jgi:hypothetical protein
MHGHLSCSSLCVFPLPAFRLQQFSLPYRDIHIGPSIYGCGEERDGCVCVGGEGGGGNNRTRGGRRREEEEDEKGGGGGGERREEGGGRPTPVLRAAAYDPGRACGGSASSAGTGAFLPTHAIACHGFVVRPRHSYASRAFQPDQARCAIADTSGAGTAACARACALRGGGSFGGGGLRAGWRCGGAALARRRNARGEAARARATRPEALLAAVDRRGAGCARWWPRRGRRAARGRTVRRWRSAPRRSRCSLVSDAVSIAR